MDEPSAGMDIESRREMWDLLLKWRNSKTIVISTHFMEEADALADWIAIMSEGKLASYGTPMYLKEKNGLFLTTFCIILKKLIFNYIFLDIGQHLSLTLNEDKKENIKKIIEIVRQHFPDSKFKLKNDKNLIFQLPVNNTEINNFLAQLEKVEIELGIKNFSLTSTTLEDVFLK